MKLQSKFFIVGFTSAALVIALVIVGSWTSQMKLQTMDDLRRISVITKRHMKADMMQDAMRGDVLSAIIAGQQGNLIGLREAAAHLKEHYEAFLDNLETNRHEIVPENIQKDFRETAIILEEYHQAAQKAMVDIGVESDQTAVLGEFQPYFNKVEEQMDRVTNDILVWSALEEKHAIAESERVDEMIKIIEILAIVIALLVPVYSWRALFRPNAQLIRVVERIAEGDMEVEIHGQESHDEIGDLARAASILRDNTREAIRLRADQERLKREAEEERKETMNRLAKQFEQRVQGIVQAVAAAATQLAQTADITIANANRSQEMAQEAASGASQTSGNVQSVASAAEELSAAVQEISVQLMRSTQLVNESVHKTQDADERAKSLASAAEKVKEVVGLISEIASQTNLLALNATIESARAGEAGKGFAVVASEVKNLATQTENSIADINRVIQEMSKAAGEIVDSLHGIRGSVTQISESASGISSAVEEQAATTSEIVRNMQTAADGTSHISSHLSKISVASSEASGSSQEVAAAARELSIQAETLDKQVREFLEDIRAA